MPFVKLDCGMLRSTIWFDLEARDVFITALLMAEPAEYQDRVHQIAVESLENTGWSAPPGWYGYVSSSGPGIVHAAKIEEKAGMAALKRLGEPDQESRSQEFDGRRMIRVDGGYLVLNYMRYRIKDQTTSERSKRYRKRVASRCDVTESRRDNRDSVTQAEAEVEADLKEKKGAALPLGLSDYPRLASNEAFVNAWEIWLLDRKSRRKPVTPHGANLSLRKLANIGPERAIAAIELSIAHGWQGIFEPSLPPGRPATATPRAASAPGWEETKNRLAALHGPNGEESKD